MIYELILQREASNTLFSLTAFSLGKKYFFNFSFTTATYKHNLSIRKSSRKVLKY